MPTQIRGEQIQDETIASNNILDGTVTTSDIAADTIGLDDIAAVVEQEFYKIKITNADSSPDYLFAKVTGKQGITTSSSSTIEIVGPYISSGSFGDGSDGSAILSGSTVTWATLSGAIYTMTRDCLCQDLTISSGYTLRVANYMIYATGRITNGGTIESRGNDASGSTPGAAYAAAGSWYSAGGAGGSGGTNAAGSVGAGSGGNSIGSGGGRGGNAGANSGGSGNASTVLNASITSYKTIGFLYNRRVATNNTWVAINGSGGGGGGAATLNGIGGGGGGGVGICSLACDSLTNNGIIQSVGGSGANGTYTSSGIAGGGGGGSAGPVFIWANKILTTGTIQSVGGANGLGANGGESGIAGTSNQVNIFKGI